MEGQLDTQHSSSSSSSRSRSIEKCGLDTGTSRYLFKPLDNGVDFKIEMKMGVSDIVDQALLN